MGICPAHRPIFRIIFDPDATRRANSGDLAARWDYTAGTANREAARGIWDSLPNSTNLETQIYSKGDYLPSACIIPTRIIMVAKRVTFCHREERFRRRSDLLLGWGEFDSGWRPGKTTMICRFDSDWRPQPLSHRSMGLATPCGRKGSSTFAPLPADW